MAARYFKLIAGIMAAGISAVSCVYPFNPEIEGADGNLVIEGDILIGKQCTFNVTYTGSFDSVELSQANATVWVEDSEGNEYKAASSTKDGPVSIDLTAAPDDRQYRLHVYNADSGHNYLSEYKQVLKAADIDSLCYIPDKQKDKLAIGLSMHTAGSHYFKWSYSEVWEYNAHYYSMYEYIVDNARLQQGHLEPFVNAENVYYCWNEDESSEIMIFSTADQTEDRFVDLEFHTIPRSDQRIMYIYYIKVQLEPMDENGYKYWNNMQQTSDNQGGFFSPTPSQMAGNITCTEDPDEFVHGYINVAQVSTDDLFYYNNMVHFYEPSTTYWPETEIVDESEYYTHYMAGYRPIEEVLDDTTEEVLGISWAPEWCSDCRKSGGTKNKPTWWPSAHI